MKDQCYKDEFVVLSQETARGWDGDDEDEEEESSEDWLWEIDEEEVNAYGNKENEVFDDGWGWVVTFASFVIYTLASMFTNCFGVLFSGFLLELHTSSSKISEIFNLALAVSSLFSFLAEPLVNQYGWRRVTFTTSLVYSAGLASSSLASSASFFFIFTMMTSGMCILILEVIAQHTVSIYFTRQRRLATCIVTMGTCASQVLMTPFITYLQEEVSSRGATLISAATVLNCCVAAMFLHPVEWHRKRHHLVPTKSMEVPFTLPLQSNKTSSASESFIRLLKGSMKNLQYLRSPRIIIISLVLACNTSSLVNIWAIVPFALKTQGYSSQDVALCLSVAGLCNMASRLGNGVISCWETFSVQKLYIIGSATSAIGIIGFCLGSDLFWKTTMFGLCGLGNGTVSTLYSLVALEAAGLNMQLPVLSLAGLVTGFWFLLVDPLTGLVRDSSGSYSVCLGVLGCFLLASVALWFFLPTPSSASRLHSQLDIEGHPLVPSSKNRPSP